MGKKIFDSGNPFNRFMSHVFDLIILNLLWLLCSLPIITFGASSIALYTMTLRLVRNEEGSLTKGFFKAFRDNFRQSVPVTLIFFFIYSLAFFNLYRLSMGGESVNAVLFGVNIAILIMITGIWVWIIPLMARYENTLGEHFNNAWRLAVSHLSYTLTFIVTTTGPLFWAAYSPQTFLFVFPLWFLLGGGGAAAINSIYIRKVFDVLEKKSEGGTENEDDPG